MISSVKISPNASLSILEWNVTNNLIRIQVAYTTSIEGLPFSLDVQFNSSYSLLQTYSLPFNATSDLLPLAIIEEIEYSVISLKSVSYCLMILSLILCMLTHKMAGLEVFVLNLSVFFVYLS